MTLLEESICSWYAAAARRHLAGDELVRHRDRAVQQVAEVVAEVRLVALEQRLVGEVAVGAERVLAQHEVAQRIDAQLVGDRVRVDRVAGIDFEIFWPFTVR